MKLTLTTNYWHEIEGLAIDPAAKDQLKAMVCSYQNKTIPPTATPHIINKLKEANIELIFLCDFDWRRRTDQVEIVHFVPDNKETGRPFTYLRPCYRCGESFKLI